MPYLSEERKKELQNYKNTYWDLEGLELSPGDMTYIFYRSCLDLLPKEYKYHDLHQVITLIEKSIRHYPFDRTTNPFTKILWDLEGVWEAFGALECAKLEFYRRVIAPYEDEKIQENGDIQ